jgi:hypothetical protein
MASFHSPDYDSLSAMLEALLASTDVWLLLKLLSLCGYTFLGVALLRRRVELVNLVAVSSVICALYVFAMTGLLLLGYWLLLIGGWLALVLAAGLAWRRPVIVGDFLTPGWLCYLACAIYYSHLVSDAVPYYWDEFDYWGFSVKEMMWTDALPDHDDLSPHLEYPPGLQMMSYFVTKGMASHEQGLYSSHFIVGAAAFWTLSMNVRWKDVYWTPFLVAISLYLYASFNRGPANLQADMILGAYLGAIVSSYLLGSLRGSALLLLAPPLFALSLIKPFGFALALLAAGSIGIHRAIEEFLGGSARAPAERSSPGASPVGEVDAALADDTEIPGGRGSSSAWLERSVRLLPVLILLAVPVAAKVSWESRVTHHGFEKDFSVAGITYEKVRDAFSSEASRYHRRVRQKFFDKVTSGPVGGRPKSPIRPSTVDWMIVITAIFVLGVLMSWRGVATRSAAIIYLCLGAGLAAYLLCLLVLFLLVHHEYFALFMGSYMRHAAAYLCGFLFVAVAFLTLNPRWDDRLESRIGKYLGLVLVVVALGAYLPPKGSLHKADYSQRGQHFGVLTLRSSSEVIRAHARPGDSVDFLDFGGFGFQQVILRYWSYPIRVVEAPPSITTKDVNDQFYRHLSVEGLVQRLNQADFLFLWRTTPDALREYSSVFAEVGETAGGPAGLYQIVKAGEGAPPRLVRLSMDPKG